MHFSRRDVLRLGGLCGLGLGLPDLLRARAGAADTQSSSFGKAKRVIMLYLHGGHPQQETFDPKPDGPSAVRGEFGAIETSVAGLRLCEHLPQTAAIAGKLAVVRSISHPNANHVQAALAAQTGHAHPIELERLGDFPPSPNDFPPVGAVLDVVRPASGALPTWVRVGPLMRRNNGTVLHGQTPGLLGEPHASFAVDQPLTAPDVEVRAVDRNAELSSIRLSGRRHLLHEFDTQRRELEGTAAVRDFDLFYQKAFGLLASDQTRRAFALSQESPATRKRYGMTEFGQRCLLARRLAEAGVPMVNVSYCHTPAGSWDTHSQNFRQMKDLLAPTFDAAFSALVSDLSERGLLDETLVVVNAEFGRTPKINSSGGRDHWPWVYSLVLAGAGVRQGTVYGASDNSAAYPTANPHDPKDFVATIYHLLGVPPETMIHDLLRRPHQVVIGRPIDGILA
ncbi:MAG TPA: DUF1501 domain-containing protein [Planctomycetaceae bacterium]|nr:DUF1501 domain-containing protein [Planctomycetaceae bacterium]